MKKHLIFCCACILLLTACTSNTYETSTLKFQKNGDDYQLVETEGAENYTELIENLSELESTLNEDTEVAVLSTSTANIVDKLGMNITAVTES